MSQPSHDNLHTHGSYTHRHVDGSKNSPQHTHGGPGEVPASAFQCTDKTCSDCYPQPQFSEFTQEQLEDRLDLYHRTGTSLENFDAIRAERERRRKDFSNATPTAHDQSRKQLLQDVRALMRRNYGIDDIQAQELIAFMVKWHDSRRP